MIDHKWYHWTRAPADVKACILAFIADRQFRIAGGPSPVLVIHPAVQRLSQFVPEPIHGLLEGIYDTEFFVPYGDDKMIAVWCRQLEVELKDA